MAAVVTVAVVVVAAAAAVRVASSGRGTAKFGRIPEWHAWMVVDLFSFALVDGAYGYGRAIIVTLRDGASLMPSRITLGTNAAAGLRALAFCLRGR